MPADPLDRLEETVSDLQRQINEIQKSGTAITGEKFERVWDAVHRLQGDIEHLKVEDDRKADADDVVDLKANYRMVRNIVIAAVATAATSIAVSIIVNAGKP